VKLKSHNIPIYRSNSLSKRCSLNVVDVRTSLLSSRTSLSLLPRCEDECLVALRTIKPYFVNDRTIPFATAQSSFRHLFRTLYCDSKARRISAVDLVRRQDRIAREEVAKHPRLRAIPRDELAGCLVPDHGEVTLPDMRITLWNRPAKKR
jgi:hypothetical protein